MEFEGTIPPLTVLDILQIIRENKLTGELTFYNSQKLTLIFNKGKITYSSLSEEEKNIDPIVNIKKSIQLLKLIKNAKFYFKSSKDLDNNRNSVNFPLESIIIEISRNIELRELTKISDEFIPEKTKNYKKMISNINITLDEIKVLNIINGKRTVKEITELLKHDLNDELKIRKILYGLLASGIIKRAERKLKIDLKSIAIDPIKGIIRRLKGS
ncbi:MAG: DUF4388 domain-containing protein [Thermosulfidibacteraceae bacterium]|jgi:transcriptional regulator of met regulon